MHKDNTFKQNEYDNLVVQLYKSLNDKNGFDEFYSEFQRVFQCQCGGLFAIAPTPLRFLFSWSFGYPAGFEQWYLDNNMLQTDEGIHKYMNGEVSHFQSYVASSDEDTIIALVSKETQAWALQMGIVDSAGALITDKDEFKLIFLLNRHESVGPFTVEDVENLNSLAIHLEQAFKLYISLYQTQKNSFSMQETLDLVNRPMFVLNLMVEIDYINSAGKQFIDTIPSLEMGSDNRLIFKDSASQKEFNELALHVGASARQNDPTSKSQLFQINDRRILLKVTPHLSEFGKLLNLIIEMFDLNKNVSLPIELISATLDCTPSEAMVAKLLSEGYLVKNIAVMRNISESTVREYVKNLLRKNKFNRQVDMITTLVRLSNY